MILKIITALRGKKALTLPDKEKPHNIAVSARLGCFSAGDSHVAYSLNSLRAFCCYGWRLNPNGGSIQTPRRSCVLRCQPRQPGLQPRFEIAGHSIIDLGRTKYYCGWELNRQTI